MDALILTVELVYHEILLIEHTEGLDYKQYTMFIMMALNVLREAKDTAGRCVLCMLLDHEWNSWAALFYVPRDHICISCVETITVLQIAEADSHAYLEVVMSSIQKESEPRLHIGFDPINFLGYFTRNLISPHSSCFACYQLTLLF